VLSNRNESLIKSNDLFYKEFSYKLNNCLAFIETGEDVKSGGERDAAGSPYVSDSLMRSAVPFLTEKVQ